MAQNTLKHTWLNESGCELDEMLRELERKMALYYLRRLDAPLVLL